MDEKYQIPVEVNDAPETPVSEKPKRRGVNTRQRKKEAADTTQKTKALPAEGNPADMVYIDGEWIEVVPADVAYFRNGTASFYRIIDLYPMDMIWEAQKGVFDPERDGDKCMIDWLVAATNNPKFVREHYDKFNAADILKMVEIFKRRTGIAEREENLKKAQTQGKEV